MTDVLKELVELTERCTPEADSQLREKMQKVAEYEKHPDFDMKDVLGCMDAICHNAAVYLRIVKAARKALPALKSLLSQEAELRELIENIRLQPEPMLPTISEFQHGHDGFEKRAAWRAEQNVAYRLETLIRRHYES